MEQAAEHTLEFLLAFDGRVHWYPAGYFAKLHAPDGKRLIGFDNAHGVPAAGSRFNRRQAAADHWHRSGDDPGRPYPFKDAAGLIEDFLDEVRRVLESRGIPVEVVETGEAGGTDD
jgi:hypothetical protein